MKRTSKRIIAITLAMVITLSLMVTGLSAVSAAAKAPYAPTNVMTQNSGTGFNITWRAAANATGYKVYYKTAESGWENKYTTTNSVNLENLEYGTLYYVQVQSIGANGGFSKVSTMTHVRSTRLVSTAYNSNATVTVGWNPADGANGYAVAKKKAGDKSYTYYYTSNTSFTDKNIEGGTIYYYQIRPYYTNGKSAAYAGWSNTKTLTTLYRPTITNVNSTDKRMNINWNRIFGAKGYRLAYKRATDSAWNYRTVNTSYYNVPNPTKGATYYIQVCAVKDNLAGPYSEPKAHEIIDTEKYKGLTFYEAGETITVNHPAETKQVKVVDQEAYSYEEPVYEMKRIAKCKDCGMDLSQLSQSERTAHSKNHVLNEGGDGGWYSSTEQVQVGTKTVNVPEQSHYETKVIKEAWTETVLVKEAGWYKTVTHPAETKQVKVVDKEAYSYEEPVYETKRIQKCKDCGMDLLQLGSNAERIAHANQHIDEGGDGGWYSSTEQVQVGTKTVNVPEQAHMETVVVKEAWTEIIFVMDK